MEIDETTQDLLQEQADRWRSDAEEIGEPTTQGEVLAKGLYIACAMELEYIIREGELVPLPEDIVEDLEDAPDDEERKVCGEYHPLPCGIDKACPDTESEDE